MCRSFLEQKTLKRKKGGHSDNFDAHDNGEKVAEKEKVNGRK